MDRLVELDKVSWVVETNDRQVNTTLHISPSTNEPILYLDGGSACPYNSEEQASTAIRVSCARDQAAKYKLIYSLSARLPTLGLVNLNWWLPFHRSIRINRVISSLNGKPT